LAGQGRRFLPHRSATRAAPEIAAHRLTMRMTDRLATRFVLLPLVAAAALAAASASAQVLPWKEACLAIQPTIACTAENRGVIEEAIASCRTAADKAACHKAYLTQLRDRPRGPPAVIRGSKVN
jgi:hypothetical protein